MANNFLSMFGPPQGQQNSMFSPFLQPMMQQQQANPMMNFFRFLAPARTGQQPYSPYTQAPWYGQQRNAGFWF